VSSRYPHGAWNVKVTDVRVYPIQGRHWPRFPWLLVEVETDEGIAGLGEALPYRSSGVYESLENIKRRLIGRDPTQIELLWEELYRDGVSLPAISGVETALWDIPSKSLKAPIHSLLGGTCRARARPLGNRKPNGTSLYRTSLE